MTNHNPYAEAIEPYVAALRMVRNAVEELFGPYADLASEEAVLANGPEPHHEAQAIIDGLTHVAGTLGNYIEGIGDD